MRFRSLCGSLKQQKPYFTGDSTRATRSRKPVWAVSYIEGSNPSLSANQGVFSALCRYNGPPQAAAENAARGSTQATVGPSQRGFVPFPFPRDAAALAYLEPSKSNLSAEQPKRSETSVDRRITAPGRGGRPLRGLIA
jgi:hypothetical protein